MPPPGLKINHNPVEVSLCASHLRRIFNEEGFMGMLETGQMRIGARRVKQRKNPSANAPTLSDAPFTEEFVIVEVATNEEVVRCQWFLRADQKTPAASGKADPKEINWKGHNYHQTGNRIPDCEHCKAGIPKFPTEDVS